MTATQSEGCEFELGLQGFMQHGMFDKKSIGQIRFSADWESVACQGQGHREALAPLLLEHISIIADGAYTGIAVLRTGCPASEIDAAACHRVRLLLEPHLNQPTFYHLHLHRQVHPSPPSSLNPMHISMPVTSIVPFWLHLLVEVPASLNFFFNPSEQLSSPAPQAHAVIKQYAVLLLVSNLIALIFARRPIDGTSKKVAGALAVYHLAPVARSLARIVGEEMEYGKALGGPWLHLLVHGGCLMSLTAVFLSGSW
ncbi:hypothetical protein G7Y89_g5014 [Cudoniella acicularis]|uniref:Uncharacterized protein n=1 Tax=Cudoniella acicularis TaxID=354080 RepID=A0A8H4RPM6_9HELO|nr:hypothetical protein G7Y89_g5014 [Cudoniella acicularis]